MGRITKDDRCLIMGLRRTGRVLNYGSYPKNKTGYQFLGHPVQCSVERRE